MTGRRWKGHVVPPRTSARPSRRVLVAIVGVAAALAVAGAVLHDRYYVRNLHEMIPGELYHCRQPTAPQWWMLRKYDIRRVINLRARQEDPAAFDLEQRLCREGGVDFVNIPVEGLLPTDEQIERFLRAVRSRPGAVLFHCEHGRHRTCFMKATYRVLLQDWTVEDAVAEMAANDARPEGQKRARTFAILRRLRDNRAAWLTRTDPANGQEPAARSQ
jgi:protein tyrosine phosphatase (PTP) superfamily phosphohydrolase (DUF442 family)